MGVPLEHAQCGHFVLPDDFIDFNEIALFLQYVHFANEDKGLIVKQDLIDVLALFLIDHWAILFAISVCEDFNPGDFLIEVDVLISKVSIQFFKFFKI